MEPAPTLTLLTPEIQTLWEEVEAQKAIMDKEKCTTKWPEMEIEWLRSELL